MKTFNTYLKNYFFGYAIVATLLIVSAASCAIDKATVNNEVVDNVSAVEPVPTATPKQLKTKKKGKTKTMKTELVSAPLGVWGGQGILANVEKERVSIQFDCADSRTEQTLMMDARGNFAADGIYFRQRGGPINSDDKQFHQPVRYEGKISGDTMTLRITFTESKEVIGEYTLQHGKTPKLTRCYMM